MDAVVALQRQGLTVAQIALRLACKPCTVFDRLREYRNATPENGRADEALRTCPKCGKRKYPNHETCNLCRKRAKKAAERAARPRRRACDIDLAKLVDLRRGGMQFARIAEVIGCHEDSAKRAYQRWVKKAPPVCGKLES